MIRPIELKGITIAEERQKLKEEYQEFLQALNEDNINHIIEEFYDMVQVAVNLMDKRGINFEDIEIGEDRHFQKMTFRDYYIKNDFNLNDMVVFGDKLYNILKIDKQFVTIEPTSENTEECLMVVPKYLVRKCPF